jgi:Putative peptidoglycan binding domain/D-alanyl-D-alanine carboxypeptidase
MSILELIPVPANINPNVRNAKQATMLSVLGNPRGSYGETCQAVENPRLRALLETRDVGPFRATGLRPALDDLTTILARVKEEQRQVYDALESAGMHCARLVRGSTSSISNHSWGTAIDVKLSGQLDWPGNGKVQRGLALIAPIFNACGWYWGAGFPREDGMHFEAGDDRIREWQGNGLLGTAPRPAPHSLSFGDEGPEVRELQQRLNQLHANLVVDGSFGRATLAAVMAFQAAEGLVVDGIAGEKTRQRLAERSG